MSSEIDVLTEGKPLIPFHRIPPHEITIIMAIGERLAKAARMLVEQNRAAKIDVDPLLLAADIAVVHLNRNLDLHAFLRAPMFEFVAEYITIVGHIDRTCGFFPAHVNLRFAQSRASH